MGRAILRVAGVQAGWFACVLGAATGHPLAGCAFVAAVLAVHLLAGRPVKSLASAVAGATMTGAAFDGALTLAGVLRFPAHASMGWPTPVWMLALWANFALVLDDIGGWLRPGAWAAALGAVGGPLTYLAAGRLGAIVFSATDMAAVCAVAVEWAAAMPLLLAWNRFLGRRTASRSPAGA